MTVSNNMRLAFGAFRVEDPVFAPALKRCGEVTIPYALRRCDETGRLDAFKLHWREGMPNKPHIYFDSDVAKVLEGMACWIKLNPDDRRMRRKLDELVELVISAQQPDGYLNTYFTQIAPEQRFANLFNCHELYCAGHLIEAAVAHFDATGETKFLDAMCRYADLLRRTFGTEPGKRRGAPGHEEIELALCKLARATGKPQYLELACYFLDERGSEPNFFLEEARRHATGATRNELITRQAHKPVREQVDADGHAVRALYLYSGMADAAGATGDRTMLRACEKLFDSIVRRRMYVTGGVGSTAFGEAFTRDFDLPAESAYNESCAAVAMALFAWRMLELTGQSRYADVLELELYNAAMSGISLAGNRFFYANPLVRGPEFFAHGHVFATRQEWFDCSCCPTTFCRFLPRTGQFLWRAENNGRTLCMNIPAAGIFDDGASRIRVSGTYPWSGRIRLDLEKVAFDSLKLRIPAWCHGNFTLRRNGIKSDATLQDNWALFSAPQPGDCIELNLPMEPEWLYPHTSVAAAAGRAALRRGPVVYCLEGVDNAQMDVRQFRADTSRPVEAVASAFAGVPALRIQGRCERASANAELYSSVRPQSEACTVTAVPYFLWENRERGSMIVNMLRQ